MLRDGSCGDGAARMNERTKAELVLMAAMGLTQTQLLTSSVHGGGTVRWVGCVVGCVCGRNKGENERKIFFADEGELSVSAEIG